MPSKAYFRRLARRYKHVEVQYPLWPEMGLKIRRHGLRRKASTTKPRRRDMRE
jgi:hypothetical protein